MTRSEELFQKAECYLQGYSVKKDRSLAINLFLKSAELGYLPAIERLKQLNVPFDVNSVNREKYTELREAMYYWGNKIPHSSFNFYFGNDIPDKKLENSINEYAQSVLKSSVIGLIDLTAFGSSSEGMLFTTAGIHYKRFLSDPIHLKYADILDVKVVYCDDNDNDRVLDIHLVNGETIKLNSSLINKTPLCRFLERSKVLAKEGKTEFSDICIRTDFMHDAILMKIRTDDFLLPHKERLNIIELDSNTLDEIIKKKLAKKDKAADTKEIDNIIDEVRNNNINNFITYYEYLGISDRKRKLLTWLYKLAKRTEYKYDMFDDLDMHEDSRTQIENILKDLFLKVSPNRSESFMFFSSEAAIKVNGYKAYVERYLPELVIAILSKIELYDNLLDRQYSTEELSSEIISLWEDLKLYRGRLIKIKKEKLNIFKEKMGVTDNRLDDYFIMGNDSESGSEIDTESEDKVCNSGEKSVASNTAEKVYMGLNLAKFILSNLALTGVLALGCAVGGILFNRYSKIRLEGAAEAKMLFEKKYVEISKEFDNLITEGNNRVDKHLLLIARAQREIFQLEIDITELDDYVGLNKGVILWN